MAATDPQPTARQDAVDESCMDSNRSLWDAWTRLHLAPGVYGVEEFRAGQSSLKPIELKEVGDVRGKTLLHLQCHFGLDTLSWARRGAIATGVDFSPEAIEAARALSAEVGLPARFVCASIYDLPDASELRGEQFDVVFTSYGVLSWLPDLAKWARVIAHFVKPGGVFYIVDRHPVTRLLFPRETDSAGNPIQFGYFGRQEPVRAEEHGSYADPETEVWTTAYYWGHSLGEIVSAVCEAGLHLNYLHEFPPEAAPTRFSRGDTHPSDDYPAWFSIRATAPTDTNGGGPET
jgi:SAM-dependent methyltransferase